MVKMQLLHVVVEIFLHFSLVGCRQALGYKLGQLKILALRDEAKQTLGDAFDIRDFNQQVLEVASTPLPYIETTVRNWASASIE